MSEHLLDIIETVDPATQVRVSTPMENNGDDSDFIDLEVLRAGRVLSALLDKDQVEMLIKALEKHRKRA